MGMVIVSCLCWYPPLVRVAGSSPGVSLLWNTHPGQVAGLSPGAGDVWGGHTDAPFPGGQGGQSRLILCQWSLSDLWVFLRLKWWVCAMLQLGVDLWIFGAGSPSTALSVWCGSYPWMIGKPVNLIILYYGDLSVCCCWKGRNWLNSEFIIHLFDCLAALNALFWIIVIHICCVFSCISRRA